jgi:hypothetical protein
VVGETTPGAADHITPIRLAPTGLALGRLEPDALVAELTPQDRDLVPQHKDLGVFILIAAPQ